jgi:hypothetical protein
LFVGLWGCSGGGRGWIVGAGWRRWRLGLRWWRSEGGAGGVSEMDTVAGERRGVVEER